jgi:hypothetical protein
MGLPGTSHQLGRAISTLLRPLSWHWAMAETGQLAPISPSRETAERAAAEAEATAARAAELQANKSLGTPRKRNGAGRRLSKPSAKRFSRRTGSAAEPRSGAAGSVSGRTTSRLRQLTPQRHHLLGWHTTDAQGRFAGRRSLVEGFEASLAARPRKIA